MKDYKTEPISCLGCGVSLDGHLEVQPKAEPKPEDASICIYCGTIGIYTLVFGKLAMRYPTDKELKEILSQDNIQMVIAALDITRKRMAGS